MVHRKKRKQSSDNKNFLIDRLQPEEAANVLRGLLAGHPELETEAEDIAKAALRQGGFEVIGDDICDAIQALGFDELNGRAGRHKGGYVEPDEAAADILHETITPFLDDLRRRLDLRLGDEALEMCKGLVLGCYRLEHEGGGELLEYASEFPAETAAYAVESWRDGSGGLKRTVLPGDFVEQFVPEWADMIARICLKRR